MTMNAAGYPSNDPKPVRTPQTVRRRPRPRADNDNRPTPANDNQPAKPGQSKQLQRRAHMLAGLKNLGKLSLGQDLASDLSANVGIVLDAIQAKAHFGVNAQFTYARRDYSSYNGLYGDMMTGNYLSTDTVVRRLYGPDPLTWPWPNNPVGYPVSSYGSAPDATGATIWEVSNLGIYGGYYARYYHPIKGFRYNAGAGYKSYVLPRAPEFYPSPVPLWVPSLDPMTIPIGVPMQTPKPLPLRIIPYRVPNPYRDPREQSHVGPTRAVVSPPGQTIIDQVDGVTVTVNPKPHRPEKPPVNVKEKKGYLPIGSGIVKEALDSVTEALDFINAVYYSIPKEFQKAGLTPQEKLRFLYNNPDLIDVRQFGINFLSMQLQDMAFGRVSQQISKGLRKAGANYRSLGYGPGF